MLRAIAGYFFGGMTQDVPPVPEECETREVKDWLVVNLPNQPIDDVDLDDAVNAEEPKPGMSKKDIEQVVKWLMQTRDGEDCRSNTNPSEPIPANPSDESDSLTRAMNLPVVYNKRSISRKEHLSLSEMENMLRNNPVSIRYKHFMVNSPKDVVLDFDELFEPPECLKQLRRERRMEEIEAAWKDLEILNTEMDAIIEDPGSLRSRRVLERAGILMPGTPITSIKQLPPLLSQKQIKRIVAKSPAVTCHPVYSPTYVNHRNPALSPKTDLLQRIKELEPEQQATQRALKTHITRGQLNRQNKNCIYDTSTKKNRRKNLQRNPSGANNNRKC